MSLTLTLTATSACDLREQILALATEYAPAADPVIQPAPKAKAKPAPIKAAEAAPAPEPAPEPVPEPVSAPEPEPVPEPVQDAPRELTFEDDITPAVLSLVNSKGRDAIIGVLSAFGITRASQCNISDYPALLTALQEAAR